MTRESKKLADTVTRSTTRRSFLSKAMKLASGVAVGIATVLTTSSARAAKQGSAKTCCVYYDEWDDGLLTYCTPGTECPPTKTIGGKYKRTIWYYGSFPVSNCPECRNW